MHEVLAATSEWPASDARGTVDVSGAFFKAWQGALWLFGDRPEEKTVKAKEQEQEKKKATEDVSPRS